MMISFDHPDVRRGRPVFVNSAGKPANEAEGVRAVLAQLGWDRARLASEAGVSLWSVNAWVTGRRRPALAALTVLYVALRHQRAAGRPATGHA